MIESVKPVKTSPKMNIMCFKRETKNLNCYTCDTFDTCASCFVKNNGIQKPLFAVYS